MSHNKIINTQDIIKARDFAIKAHWGQMYGSLPYIDHLDSVALICKKYKLPEYVQVAAYLHDIVEDTHVSANQISLNFGYDVATLVYAVTDAEGKDRTERKEKTYPKILAHPYGVFLKLADRISNIECSLRSKESTMIDKYLHEHKAFFEKLYTPGIAQEMWDELENLITKVR